MRAGRSRWRAAPPSFRDRWTYWASRQGSCHLHSDKPEQGGRPVNSTARWPQRLEHLAWLLRAEAVAVVVATADPPSTVFSHRIEGAAWHAILGEDAFARAAGGVPRGVQLGGGQRLDEGIAGWVATSGEKVVLRGRVTDERFHGVDPDARESISVPLRVGDDVLGVLSVKRPQEADGFSGRQTLLDGIAADLSRALQAMNVISALQREREHAEGFADVALAVASGDAHGAARAAAESLGHHAVAVRNASGKVLAVYAPDDDPECRAAALGASEQGGSADVAGATGVGFARHDPPYEPAEAALA